ncbi:MAG: class I SAM-dependent methyltransferase [Desulfovibrionaceae bacterium]|nr:class I SAM-dependent methyltransferase [Desulfovibrionaceae bacterium]MBF0514718.1 class I SAM-dependent methyltransferase [Desulfovibrionaceae bacterium]
MQHPASKDQIAYWDAVASAHDCTLQPPLELFTNYLPKDAKILDFGCGYGRSLAGLSALGFTDLTGFDPSPAMLERGRREHPGLDLRPLASKELPVPDACADAVLLVGVLTAVAEDDDQRGLVAAIFRVLRPGGLLLLCDFPLQNDARNRERYERFAAKCGRYGVFEVTGGGLARHHDPAWLAELTGGFKRLETLPLSAVTLTGKPAEAVCLILRKPA